MSELNWTTYIRDYCIGLKKYLLKEDLPNVSAKPSPKQSLVKTKYDLFL